MTIAFKKTRLLLAFLAMLVGVSPAWAEELTVCDGSATNADVPVAGFYADTNNQKCQFIIPASQLTSISGATITKMQFYLSSSASAAWSATYDVYVKEVSETQFETSGYYNYAVALDTDGSTTVYSGTLDATGSTMDITFSENYEYNGGNLLVSIYMKSAGSNYPNATFTGIESTNGSWYYRSSSNKIASFIPKTTFTYEAATPGPKLAVYDGASKLSTGHAYNFGLSTAGTTKTFTLKNPGTESLTVGVSETGNFGATLASTTIPAAGETTLTLTMPAATGSSVVTITPAAESGLDAFVINVSGTVRDPNRLYETLLSGSLPDEWTTSGGTWIFSPTNGASNTAWYESSNYRLITPLLTVAEGEQFIFEAQGTYNGYQGVIFEYSADGTIWTASSTATTVTSDWQTFYISDIPAGKYYIALHGWHVNIRNFYGGSLPVEPKLSVTQPASLSYGIINEATAKTFTIANTGLATLEGINVTSSNAAFTITNAPTSLAAGAGQEVTITMSAENTGAQSSTITVSATGMDNVQFTVDGAVMKAGTTTVDFNDNALPANWTNASWTFANGAATGKSSSAYLTTSKLQISEGDFIAIKAKRYDSDATDYITVQGSSDNGSTWTAYSKKISGSEGLSYPDYSTLLLSDIPTTVNKLRFVGYYVIVDKIAGLTYAPVLSVTKNEAEVETPANYDFGECAADADVTYNFANAGAGTINITNVTITGDGAATYTTNWTESVATPFNLTITRSYDAERIEAQVAVVTVTTSEGNFVINVTGTDKAANAPELAVTLGGETVTTGDAANFGSQLQAAPAAKTYTITNAGTGTLTGTIATSDDTQFTVSKTSFSLGAGENTTFDLALVFNETYGAKSATITIHPTNDGLSDVVINATASTLDPEAWTEDFADGTLPTGWEQGTWTIGTFTSYENKTNMALAPSGSTAGTIITPRLSAKAGDILTWDGYFNWYDEAMTVEYSSDKESWTKIYDAYKAQTDFGSTRYTHKEMSFTAPADGYYYLRFTSTYSNGVDNFAGFKLSLPDHILAITGSNIPTSGSYSPSMKATKSFNATVEVTESRGVAEEFTAKLYMGSTVIGTQAGSVEANGSEEVTIVCTPTEAATEGVEMHIEVEYAGGILSTDPETRYVAEFVKLELTETIEKEITTGYGAVYDQVTLTRSFVQGWNTFVSPLVITLSDIHANAVAYSFTGYADGALSFSKVTGSNLSVATPYIIYVPEAIAEKTFSWDEPVIYSTYVGAENIKTTKNDATFQGTYAPMAAGTMTGKYGVTSDAKIAKGSDSATMKGFRAYFELPGAAPARLEFKDENGIVTTINSVELDMNVEGVYNLNGQKVEKLQKGLYIMNGKKVVRK